MLFSYFKFVREMKVIFFKIKYPYPKTLYNKVISFIVINLSIIL